MSEILRSQNNILSESHTKSYFLIQNRGILESCTANCQLKWEYQYRKLNIVCNYHIEGMQNPI